jgi:NAD(P)-dependent dehydrogenase (short-subunit alcohol dehydrogenase family)
VIGGTSAIGFGAAQAALEAGAFVVVASRSTEKVVEAAVTRLGTGATGRRERLSRY